MGNVSCLSTSSTFWRRLVVLQQINNDLLTE